MSELKIGVHPGEILEKDFLEPLGMSQTAFAAHVGISRRAINEIIGGKRGITANTAIRFAMAFGTTPQWWMNMQSHWELCIADEVADVSKLEMLG